MLHEKSQSVRLLDVFLLGPFMIAAGVAAGKLPTWMRIGLVAGGVGTFAYNLNNYLGNRPSPEIEAGMDPNELVRGTMHEMEHTADFDVAKRIAMDHLEENPRYYTELERCGL